MIYKQLNLNEKQNKKTNRCLSYKTKKNHAIIIFNILSLKFLETSIFFETQGMTKS